MKIQVIRQFSVFMPNKPGALSRLTQLIAQEHINILGIASEVKDDSGMVRFAVDEHSPARKIDEFSRVAAVPRKDIGEILTQGGFSTVETSLLSIEVTDRPGELARVTKAIGEGNVNITTVYGTAIAGQFSRILIAVENTEKAKALLESIKTP